MGLIIPPKPTSGADVIAALASTPASSLDAAQLAATQSLVSGGYKKLKRLASALASARAGSGVCSIEEIGDSTSAGFWSNGPNGFTDARKNAPTKYIADALSAAGYSVETRCIGGSQGTVTDADFVSYHSGTVSMGTGWTAHGALTSYAGAIIQNPGVGNLTPLTWTPDGTYGYVDVWYIQASAYGSFDISVGGVKQGGTVITNGTLSIVKTTRAFTQQSGPVSITKTADGTVTIIRVAVRSLNVGYVGVWNAGWGGSTCSNWMPNSNQWDPMQILTVFNPDAVIVNLGINEWLQNVSPSTYATNLSTIVSTIRDSSDVIIRTGIPSAITSQSKSVQEGIVAQTRSVAAAFGCPVVDINAAWRTRIAAGALGYFGSADDPVHPYKTGYADIGAAEAALLRLCT